MQTHVAQFSLVAKRVSVAYCIVYSGQPEALALTNSQEKEMHWLDFYAVYPIQPCLWHSSSCNSSILGRLAWLLHHEKLSQNTRGQDPHCAVGSYQGLTILPMIPVPTVSASTSEM